MNPLHTFASPRTSWRRPPVLPADTPLPKLPQPTTRRRLRRLGMAAFALICVIGALQARRGAASPAVHPAPERLRAVEQAASLLLAAPGANAVPAELANAVPNATPNVVPNVVPNAVPDAVPDAMPDAGSGKPVSGVFAAPGAPLQPLMTKAFPARPKAVRAAIPDKIETPSRIDDGSDPLDGVTVTSGLRVLDGTGLPLRVVAIQAEQAVPRVQIESWKPGQAAPASREWLQVGDLTASRWYVASIAGTGALLLSPHGNPVRLHLSKAMAPPPDRAPLRGSNAPQAAAPGSAP